MTAATDKSAKVEALKHGLAKAYVHLNGLCREVSDLEIEANELANELSDGEVGSWDAHLYLAGLMLENVWELFDGFLPCHTSDREA